MLQQYNAPIRLACYKMSKLSLCLEAFLQVENAFLVEITQDIQQTLLRNRISDGDVDRTDAKQKGQELRLARR